MAVMERCKEVFQAAEARKPGSGKRLMLVSQVAQLVCLVNSGATPPEDMRAVMRMSCALMLTDLLRELQVPVEELTAVLKVLPDDTRDLAGLL